jgi:hypothetical protein
MLGGTWPDAVVEVDYMLASEASLYVASMMVARREMQKNNQANSRAQVQTGTRTARASRAISHLPDVVLYAVVLPST